MNNPESFSAQIKAARHAAGLTQKSMSDRFGIPKRSIENWEGGQRTPPEWAARLLLKELAALANDSNQQ